MELTGLGYTVAVAQLSNEFLARATQALQRNEEEEALGLLVHTWRQSRSERIAALVDRLSKRLTQRLGVRAIPFEPRSFALSPPGMLELALLLDDLLETAAHAEPGVVSARLKAFQQGPADPRFTSVLLALAGLPVAQVPEVTQELCNLLVEMWDPRVVLPLRVLCTELEPRSPYAEKLETAVWRIAPRDVLTLTEEAVAECEALEEALTRREEVETLGGAEREELLTRVYADPGDVSARLVLADVLLAQGNPRGELIVLQCSPHADRERINRVLAEYGWLWSAVLGPSVDRGATRFERGFPVAVRLMPRQAVPLPEPLPAWATVREVDVGGAAFTNLAEWLSHPRLRGVTTLTRVEPSLVAGLAAREHGVRQLGLAGLGAPPVQEVCNALARLPALVKLFLRHATADDVHLCAMSPLASRLERFEARAGERWALVVTPAKSVPLRATLVAEEGTEALARVLRGAVGFGTRGLHVRTGGRATPAGLELLKAAASVYARVEWS